MDERSDEESEGEEGRLSHKPTKKTTTITHPARPAPASPGQERKEGTGMGSVRQRGQKRRLFCGPRHRHRRYLPQDLQWLFSFSNPIGTVHHQRETEREEPKRKGELTGLQSPFLSPTRRDGQMMAGERK
jgi:hypothetical protein